MAKNRPAQAELYAPPATSTDSSSGALLHAALQGVASESPTHQRLRKRLESIGKLSEQLEQTRTAGDDHRQACARVLGPLQQRLMASIRNMALWLDQRGTRPGLGKVQRANVSRLIIQLTAMLVPTGDAEMEALHDRHAPLTHAEQQQNMHGLLRQLVGDDSLPEDADDAELLKVFAQKLQRKADATQQSSRRKRVKPPTAAQLKAQEAAAALTTDADQTLRSIYRQLASALHPDREPDPALQAEKTTLMSQANAAYASRDLATLLQLMLKADVLDLHGMTELADERAQALDALFAEQERTLRRELKLVQDELRAEFDLMPFESIKPVALRQALAQAAQQLGDAVAMAETDLHGVLDDAFFKRWLKQQCTHL
jgi:hypothetical protein